MKSPVVCGRVDSGIHAGFSGRGVTDAAPQQHGCQGRAWRPVQCSRTAQGGLQTGAQRRPIQGDAAGFAWQRPSDTGHDRQQQQQTSATGRWSSQHVGTRPADDRPLKINLDLQLVSMLVSVSARCGAAASTRGNQVMQTQTEEIAGGGGGARRPAIAAVSDVHGCLRVR